MKSVAVLGAGITGLTAAFRLSQRNLPVTIYEAGGRAGGVIDSLCRDGYLVESGPQSILETSPQIQQLIGDLGLENRRIYSHPQATNRYLVRHGKLRPVPESPLEFFASPLFHASAKFRLLLEPFISRAPADCEESVAQFVRRRLGGEFLDYAVNPLVGGIYAGDPERLSLRQAFPKLYDLEQKYGSLILGQILGARERRRRKEVSKKDAKKFSFDHGLKVLIDALQARLGPALSLQTPVRQIKQNDNGWTLTAQRHDSLIERKHSAVLYAAPAYRSREIQLVTRFPFERNQETVDRCWKSLAQIHYPPVASVSLGFWRQDVAHPLNGFGMLIPAVEPFHILGTIFSSALFPNRAPAGYVLLTSFLGGARSPDLPFRSSEELIQMTLSDLRALLGVRGSPTFEQVFLFAKAVPQYEVGFGRFKSSMEEIEHKAPGFFLAGHFRDGISLSDSLVSGWKAAEKIEIFLAARPSDRLIVSPMPQPAVS